MQGRPKGNLFVLSGPSGTGKGTLRKILFERVPGIEFSISCTTRDPRDDEKDGIDYRFITDREFRARLDDGEFLEHAFVHGYYYGTLRSDVVRALESGRDILLEIDVQGALQVRAAMPESRLIFVSPPSFEELENRLRDRGTETEERLRVRLHNALLEMEQSCKYDHVIINDRADRAADELTRIVLAYRDADKRPGGASHETL